MDLFTFLFGVGMYLVGFWFGAWWTYKPAQEDRSSPIVSPQKIGYSRMSREGGGT